VKPERKKGSSFAILARIDHVRFVSVRGEGAVETASVASYEKKKNFHLSLYIIREKKEAEESPWPRALECFREPVRHSLETECAEFVKARYDRARIERGFSYARIFARKLVPSRASLFRLVIQREIDRSVHLPARGTRRAESFFM